MRLRSLILTIAVAGATVPAAAQDRLTLADAVERGLAQHPALRVSAAAVGEASARVMQARSGYLPRLDLIESAQRGNQPVFAFSSLLAARQFSASHFAVGTLNHPEPITNHHTALSFEQPLFDGLRARTATRSAHLGLSLSETLNGQARQDVALGVTRAYGQVLLAAATRRASEAAVKSAEEDLARTERRRDVGLVTEADVLSLEVHLARMRERQIAAVSDETVARAELNQAMGESLDRQFTLDDVAPAAASLPPIAQLEREALANRPEVQAARLQQALAREAQTGAKAAFLPQVSVQGFIELNGNAGAFTNRASAWMVGAQARWSIFQGLADVGRLREAGASAARATADRERVETSIRVDVRTAAARIDSALARQRVGEAVLAQALESQRIIRDRYEAGMASVNDVLRAANAVLDAESQRVGARIDLLVSSAALERAVGRPPATPQSN